MAEKKMRPTVQDKETMKLRRRKQYIAGRLPGLTEELAALRTERKTLKDKKQLVIDPKSSDAKALNRRRNYVTARIESLRAEREALLTERKTISERLESATA
jgi:predicted  nucleic acid-binding Zn-ribbon protein